MNMNEQKLYADQMKHWFDEHTKLRKQIEGTITFHEEMAQSNREQLFLHNKRVDLARVEYNAWAEKNNFPIVE